MIHIGIDPGASGGIAWLCADPNSSDAFAMPSTHRDILDRLDALGSPKMTPMHATLEHVKAMPTDGRSSLAKFMQNFGALQMALTALEIPYSLVTPPTWLKAFGLKKHKNETNTQWKNRHKAKAQQLFPHLTITHATADALLLAEYGRRNE